MQAPEREKLYQLIRSDQEANIDLAISIAKSNNIALTNGASSTSVSSMDLLGKSFAGGRIEKTQNQEKNEGSETLVLALPVFADFGAAR